MRLNIVYIIFLLFFQVFMLNILHSQPTKDTVVVIYQHYSKQVSSIKKSTPDTIRSYELNEPTVLIGNDVFKGSKNNYSSKVRYGLCLEKVEGTECLDDFKGVRRLNLVLQP